MFRRVFRAGMPLLVAGVLVGCSDHPDMMGDGSGDTELNSITLLNFFQTPGMPLNGDNQEERIFHKTFDSAVPNR